MLELPSRSRDAFRRSTVTLSPKADYAATEGSPSIVDALLQTYPELAGRIVAAPVLPR